MIFIIAAVLFHFYMVAPFLIGMFRGQQESELLALIANDPRRKSVLRASFPSSDESSDQTTTAVKKSSESQLVKPVESVLSFFENRKRAVVSS